MKLSCVFSFNSYNSEVATIIICTLQLGNLRFQQVIRFAEAYTVLKKTRGIMEKGVEGMKQKVEDATCKV